MAQTTKNYTIRVGIIGNAEFQRFQRGIDDLRKSTREASRGIRQMSESMGGLQRMAGLASKAMALFYSAQGLKSIIDQADAMRNLEASFSVLRGSAEAGANMMERVFAIAKGTGAPINDVSEAVQRLSIGMGEMGASNAQISQVADTFIKLGRVGGASMADINGALVQFSQGLSSGRLQGDEFKSIAERLPLVMRALSEEMGVSVGELKKLGSEGKITSDIMANAMINAAEGVNDQFSKLPKTFEQATNNLKTMFVEFLNTEAVRSAVQGLADILSDFTTGLSEMTADIKKFWNSLSDGEKAIAKVGAAITALTVLIAKNPWGALATGLVAASLWIIKNWRNVKGFFMFDLPIAMRRADIAVLEFSRQFVLSIRGAFINGAKAVDGFIAKFMPAVNLIRELAGLPTLTATVTKGFDSWIDTNTSKLAAARSEIEQIQRWQEVYNTTSEKTTEAVGALSGGFNKLGEEAKKAGKSVKETLSLFEELFKAAKDNTQAVAALPGALEALRKAFDAGALSLTEYIFAMDSLNKKAEDLGVTFQQFSTTNPIAALAEGSQPLKTVTLDIQAFNAEIKTTQEELWVASEDAYELAKAIDEGVGRAMEDSIINLAKTGKLAFKDMATSILEDIARMIIRMKVLEPLMRSLGLGRAGAELAGVARGGVFMDGVGNGRPYTAYASGGIISSRTTIGSALIGEAGGGRSEAIVPLRRHGGSLGVSASPVNVNVVNNAGAQVEVSESTGNDGSRTIDIMIEQKVRETVGNGSIDRMLKARYGLRPIGG